MKLLELLKEKKLSIAAAESCTGGAFMAALVRVPGASEVFRGGVVAYSPDAKVNLLGVKTANIVSEEMARQMAIGVKAKFGSDIGVAVTGYAHKGLVCFAINDSTVTKNFVGTRGEVIDASVEFLINWLCEKI